MGVDRAWSFTRGQPAVTIAVVGTGFDLADPVMARAWRLNDSEAPDAGDVVVRVATVSNELFCRFPGSAGAASIDSALLRQLAPGRGGVLEAGSFGSEIVSPANGRVTLRLYRLSVEGGVTLK